MRGYCGIVGGVVGGIVVLWVVLWCCVNENENKKKSGFIPPTGFDPVTSGL